MSHFSTKFVSGILAVVLLASLVACGGAAGTTSGTTAGSCNNTTYVPNYATASMLTLRKWPSLPIRVHFSTSTVRDLTTIEQLCRDGFNYWEAQLGANLWTEVADPAFADLKVNVETVAPQSTLGITTVFFTTGTTVLQDAEMTIYNWNSLLTGSFAPTATHELGHALGIGGHSGSSLDLMYFTGNGTDLLTAADLNTVRTAYCSFGGGAAPSRLKPLRSEMESHTDICDVIQ